MNQYKRFSITRDEGQLVELALALAIDRIIELDCTFSPYWRYYKEQMIIFKRRISEYDWRKSK